MSDYIGRKTTYFIFFTLGILLYLSIPYSAKAVSIDPTVTYLLMFYGASMIIFTMYGGGFATIPAYLADIFGTRYVGGIMEDYLRHGQLLVFLGQLLSLNYVRILESAIFDLANKISPEKFMEIYGDSVDNLANLVKQKTVTISNLMQHMPEGTVNPSATLIILQCLLWLDY